MNYNDENKWFRYVSHADKELYENAGWVTTGALYGTHHGVYSDLYEWPHKGEPVIPVINGDPASHPPTDYAEPLLPQDVLKASTIVGTAADFVKGDREHTHGDKLANHRAIACIWNGYFKANGLDVEVSAHDVALMMVLLKVARTLNGAFNVDDYIDIAGYAGVAGEVMQRGGANHV